MFSSEGERGVDSLNSCNEAATLRPIPAVVEEVELGCGRSRLLDAEEKVDDEDLRESDKDFSALGGSRGNPRSEVGSREDDDIVRERLESDVPGRLRGEGPCCSVGGFARGSPSVVLLQCTECEVDRR
jgi:hypothetical protein